MSARTGRLRAPGGCGNSKVYEAFARVMGDKLLEWGVITADEMEERRYGLKNGAALLTSTLTILIIGLLMGTPLEGVVFLLAFWTLRRYAGGYHCEGQLACYVFSTAITVLVLAAGRSLAASGDMLSALNLGVIGALLILGLSPVEARNKPLDDLERKVYRGRALKWLAIQSVAAVLLAVAGFHSLSVVLCLTLLLTGLMALLGALSLQRAMD